MKNKSCSLKVAESYVISFWGFWEKKEKKKALLHHSIHTTCTFLAKSNLIFASTQTQGSPTHNEWSIENFDFISLSDSVCRFWTLNKIWTNWIHFRNYSGLTEFEEHRHLDLAIKCIDLKCNQPCCIVNENIYNSTWFSTFWYVTGTVQV